MVHYDETQKVLEQYLMSTEMLMNELLSEQFSGCAQIKFASDLGFPHDVIRIAGGFATGAHVSWISNRGDRHNRDLLINSNLLGIEGSAKMIEQVAEQVFAE